MSKYHVPEFSIHLTKRMSLKLIEDHIAVSAIAPGAFKSDMDLDARDRPEETAKRIPRAASAKAKTWRAPRSTSPRTGD